MISAVLVDILHNANIGLTKGINLFVEKATSDKCVVVSVTSSYPEIDNSNSIRASRVNILINNFPIQEGYELGEEISGILDAVSNYNAVYTVGSTTFTYEIKTIKILDFPVFIGAGNFYTINLDVYYSQK